ncbi:MAG: UDP-N-acetylmuramate:L-alanyl-gamma-D-glutamyl-meso-diaminopimelate ligase [Alphaproteobacteria bacterium]|nr:UDP-N-acetylmuramate:L-alanyl-gamma-D-glutamyl-meso-diaminopimelate ligase [Alphaproteobacteria bacterium]
MPLVSALPPPPATVHLIGICGTAMGALAGMLQDLGYRVTGSDTGAYPPMSTYLEGLGIPILQGFEASNLDHDPDLVVVGNVVRAEYPEAVALRERDLPWTSLPAILGAGWLQHQHGVVVAGTHGKTTTTAITAWLLEAAGLQPGFLIGGVARNFDRTARAGAGQAFVVEGDEYDTAYFDKRPKFVHYHPRTAVLTSVEFDHADIYADLEAVRASFRLLVQAVPADGLLIARWDDPEVRGVVGRPACEVWRYGPGQAWDGRIERVDEQDGTMTFTVLRDGAALGTFTSCLVGEHNLANQVAAAAAATRVGATPAQLAQGFASFLGIKRRQEVRGTPGEVTVLDDFAHHPTAVRVTLDALRVRFGARRLWAIWEPRSATSRRDVFQQAYTEAFDVADRVIVAPAHDQSRIPEEERFSSARLAEALTARGVDALALPDVDAIAATVAAQALPHDVVAVLSNGAFGGLHVKLLERLGARFPATD